MYILKNHTKDFFFIQRFYNINKHDTPYFAYILKTKQKCVYASIKTLFDIVSRIYLTKILNSPYLRNCNAMGGGG